jgi:hypothetical protein
MEGGEASPAQRMVVRDEYGRLVVLSPEQAQQYMAAQAFGHAESLLADPPPSLHRYGNAWHKYLSREQADELESARKAVAEKLMQAQRLGTPTKELVASMRTAEATVREVKAAAVRGAAAAPWSEALRGALLQPARGGGSKVGTAHILGDIPHHGARTCTALSSPLARGR